MVKRKSVQIVSYSLRELLEALVRSGSVLNPTGPRAISYEAIRLAQNTGAETIRKTSAPVKVTRLARAVVPEYIDQMEQLT